MGEWWWTLLNDSMKLAGKEEKASHKQKEKPPRDTSHYSRC